MGLKKQEQELIAEQAITGKPTKRKQWEAKPSHKVIHTVVTILATLLVIGGGAYAYYFFTHETETTISNNPGPIIRRTVEGLNAAAAKFDEPAFSFQLPNDWKRMQPDLNGPYKKYWYQSQKTNATNRDLYVYVDGIPRDMAVNKAIRVDAEGERLSHGELSAQCTDFTADTGVLKAPAKWDGIDFLCDMDSKTRNVIGTSSPGNINKVTLTNVQTASRHDYFIVYTDHNYNPDYSIFYGMLESFTSK